MNKIFRTSLTLAVLAAAVASQALNLNYAGNGSLGSGSTLSLGYLGDDFNFAKSTTTANTLTLLNTAGTSGLTITTAGLTPNALFAGTGTVSGFGAFSGYTGSVAVTTITTNSYGVFAQGVVNAVPEPSAFAALGLGGLGLLRRRRKA